MLAGDYVAAEESLRAGYRALDEMGEKALLSTTAAFLAQAIFAQGRDAEAEQLAALSEELSASGDLLTQVLWRSVRARVMAAGGRAEEGEALAREAVTLAEKTDFLNHQADAITDLAEVLREAGRTDEAYAAASKALGLYERKGNRVAAERARSRLAELAPV
jgi:ATP/maltotriose-dependent transcriptional regulator MalT